MHIQSRRFVRVAASIACATLCAFAVTSAHGGTTPLARLSSPEAWETRGDALPLSAESGFVAVALHPAGAKTSTDLVLKEPVPIPVGHEVFFDAALGCISPILMNILARDSEGRDFVFINESYATIQQGNFLGGHFRGGLDELGLTRVRVPGMQTLARESFYAFDGDRNTKPVPPLSFTGIRIERVEGLEQDTGLYLSNFRITDANFRDEPFYYAFKDAQFFGGPDGAPVIRPTDFGRIWGDLHILDWELRQAYDGQPVLAGCSRFEFAADDPRPYKLRFTDGARMPALPEGTYWVRAKLRSGFNGGVPVIVRELEFRYDVFRNDSPEALPASPIPADARIGDSRIRVAPEHASFTWGEKERFRTTVRFYECGGATARIEVSASDGRILASREEALSGAVATVDLDLSTLPPGVYAVSASIVSADGATLDSLSRLIGRKARGSGASRFRLPDGIPHWRDIRDGDEQLVLFCPMVNDPAHSVEHYAKLFDEMVASGDSRAAEIQTSWNACEPLPGIYDFSAIDGILDEAAKRGIRCFVTFAPLAPPEWMPSRFTQSAEGTRFGHTMYLFHGGRINLFQDPLCRGAALAYLRALVLHTRNHPGLLGYFYIAEHSGEAPWADWHEGFDPQTLANFRDAMKRRYRRIARANEAWKTDFADFDSVRPPAFAEESSLALRRDWLVFRREGIYSFILESAKTVRDLDPHRILMVYLDGVINTRLTELAKYGAISANGGCAVPEYTFLQGAYAEAGIPQRAEEISCTYWSWIPFQLDRSLFNMMGGGGANGHWKMFVPQDAKFADLRDGGRHSLDRFEKFMPIWRELREAKPVFGDIRIWAGFEGGLVQSRSVNCAGLACDGWEARAFLDSQLPLGMNATPGWTKAKCVLVSPNQTVLSTEEAASLVRYVKDGGSLFMTADTGRHVIGREGDGEDAGDWRLLRDFGFGAPLSEAWDIRNDLVAAPGSPWAERGRGDFRVNVRTVFAPPEDAGEVLLSRDYDGAPGLTRKGFGKGSVTVLWYNVVVPHGESGRESSESLYREISRDAGAELPVETTTRKLWTNLLRKGDDTWYLLATSRDQLPEGGFARVSLPEGEYAVDELISGQSLGAIPSHDLAANGVEVRLAYNEVKLFRFVRK